MARCRRHGLQKFPNQYVFVLELDEYIYCVRFVESDEEIFLKTIIPSRKLKKNLQEKSMKKSEFVLDAEATALICRLFMAKVYPQGGIPTNTRITNTPIHT